MTAHDEATDHLQSVWDVQHNHADLDEDCSPTKPCRNMSYVTFDGYAEPGADLGEAWRALLAREGKLNESGEPLRDLVFGRGEQP